MSFDKSIEHGKEKRRQYRGAKSFDCTCRNHGGCPFCEGTRTHNTKRRKAESQYDCTDCYDTGCVCGGIGLSCDGCCHCVDIEEEDDNQSSSELPKRTKSNSGILTWSLGDDPETGVHIYPPDPTPVRSRCDEVCSWRGYGYSGSAYSCTLREWAGMEKEGLTVRSIIRGTMGSEVHDQVDEEVNRMLPV